MKIEFSLVLFLLGIFLTYAGIDTLKSMDISGLVIQYAIQSILGIVVIMLSFRLKKDE